MYKETNEQMTSVNTTHESYVPQVASGWIYNQEQRKIGQFRLCQVVPMIVVTDV